MSKFIIIRCQVFLAALLVAAHFFGGASATSPGAITLDNYTFDKMIATPGMTFLTKFDNAYPSGEKENAFKEICKLAHSVKDLIVAEVPVQEYGAKENQDLANRFQVKKEEYPAYFLWKVDSKETPVKFEGFANPAAMKPRDWDKDEDGDWEAPMITEPTAANLLVWLKMHKVRMPSADTISELDALAESFMLGGGDTQLAAAKTLAETDHKNDKKAPVYIKIMQKVMEKGHGYVQTELTRVQKLLTRQQVTASKKDELHEKVKILNVFAAASA